MRALPNNVTTRPALIVTAGWICAGLALAAVLWGLQGGERSLGSALTAHGATAVATVTAGDPAGQGTASYRFAVGGRTYGTGYVGNGPGGPAGRLVPGDRIAVVYDTENPVLSCYCDVAGLSKAPDRWRTVVLALLVTAVPALVIGLGRSRRRGEGGAPSAALDTAGAA